MALAIHLGALHHRGGPVYARRDRSLDVRFCLVDAPAKATTQIRLRRPDAEGQVCILISGNAGRAALVGADWRDRRYLRRSSISRLPPALPARFSLAAESNLGAAGIVA